MRLDAKTPKDRARNQRVDGPRINQAAHVFGAPPIRRVADLHADVSEAHESIIESPISCAHAGEQGHVMTKATRHLAAAVAIVVVGGAMMRVEAPGTTGPAFAVPTPR